MNSFLKYGADFADKPPRWVFARVTEADIDRHEQPVLQFSAVDADWFLSPQNEGIKRDEFFDIAPLSVVEISGNGAASLGFADGIDGAPETDLWFTFYFDDRYVGASQGSVGEPNAFNDGIRAQQYFNLFGVPFDRHIRNIDNPSPQMLHRLATLTSLDDVAEAEETQLRDALSLSGQHSAVAVYDVGQGNCNAVINDVGVPLIYFDFGGGVLGNTRTFPLTLSSFCWTFVSTVVLSHWDWDHWSSIGRDSRAANATWIIPKQRLGFVHRAAAAAIERAGSLLVWPRSLTQLTEGALTVKKCTGRPRNHDGLALFVNGPKNEYIALTGDAEYRHVAGLANPCGLVATHHGGRLASSVPAPHSAAATLAYSYGAGNTYGHPRLATRVAHSAAGWARVLETATPLPLPAHIAIGFCPLTPTKMPCSGRCQLDITQT